MALTLQPFQSFHNPQLTGVGVAPPQALYLQGSSTPIMPSGGRAGVAPPVQTGNITDLAQGFIGGAERAAANTVQGLTDLRWLTPNFIPGVSSLIDPAIAKFSNVVSSPFRAAADIANQAAPTKLGHIGNVAGQAGIYAPQVLPAIGGAIRLAHDAPDIVNAIKAAKVPLNEVGGLGNQDVERVGQDIAQATSGSDPVARTAQRIAQNLETPFNYSPSENAMDAFNGILNGVKGADTNALVQADHLGKVVKNSVADTSKVTDTLEGVHPPDAETANTGGILKQLHGKAFGVRQKWDPSLSEEDQYSPRFGIKSPNVTGGRKIGILKPASSISDLLNPIQSRHNLARGVQKFVSEDGKTSFVGKASDYGLSEVHQGTFEDNAGRRYTTAHVTTRDINASGSGYKFRLDAAKNARDYMLDTMLGRNRDYAADLLKNDGRFGIRQLASGEEPEFGEKPIIGIKGLHNYVAPDQIADKINTEIGLTSSKNMNPALWAYRRLTDLATQAIVRNPLIHGMNMAVQSTIAAGDFDKTGINGVAHMAAGMAKYLTMNAEDKMDLVDQMGKDGMHLANYGKDEAGILSRLTLGRSKYSSKAMASIDLNLRAGAYIAAKDMGLDGKKATAIVNRFMGAAGKQGNTRDIFLFAHYLKTLGTSLYSQGRHPIENMGANLVTAAIGATYYGLDKALRKELGNKSAYITPSGELGIIKEGAKLGQSILQNGKNIGADFKTVGTSSLLMNHLNPIGKELGLQLIPGAQDPFTGKTVASNRLGNAENNLTGVAPQLMDAKKSAAEKITNEFRIYTPHAPGDVATTNPALSFLNKPGAKKDTQPGTNDPTGYTQEIQSINFSNKIQQMLSGNKTATDAYNLIKAYDTPPPGTKFTSNLSPSEQEALDMKKAQLIQQLSKNPNALNAFITLKQYNRVPPGVNFKSTLTLQQQMTSEQAQANSLIKLSKNPQDLQAYLASITRDRNKQGQIVLNGPGDTTTEWQGLFQHPAALFARQQQELQMPNHSPEWDIKGSGTLLDGQQVNKMAAYAQYKSLGNNLPAKDTLIAMNPWINDLNNKIGTYINQLPKGSSVAGPNYIPYPNVLPSATAKQTTIDQLSAIPVQNRTADQENQLRQLQNSPDVQQAYEQQYAYSAAVAAQFGEPSPPGMTSPDGGVTTIGTLAQQFGLDPKAVLSVAAHEGLSGGVGDNGTSFGPFQLHAGGALPKQVWDQGPAYAQQWAWSPTGISYALQTMAGVAKGLKGQDAINAIVNNFERPADPGGEISAASYYYNNTDAISQIAAGNPSIFSPAVQQFMNAYNGGDKSTRTVMRNANPNLFAQMQNYMNSQDLVTAEKGLSKSYYGAPLTSSTLGSIANLGQYGITETPTASGAKSYGMFTATPGKPFKSSSGGGSYSKGYQYGEAKGESIGRRQEKLATSKPTQFRESQYPKVKAHVAGKRTKIKVRGGSVRLVIPKVKVQ